MPENKRESMIFYASFYEAAKQLPEAERLEFLSAVFEYGLYGAEQDIKGTPKSMLTLIKPQLDANIRRYQNGCKGGRPPKTDKTKIKPKNNLTETESKPNYNVNVNDNLNENYNDNHIMSTAQLRIDYHSIVSIFNLTCSTLPKVRAVTDARKKAIKAVYKTVEDNGGFAELFRKVNASDFLSGRSGAWSGCGFDWVLKRANLIKVIEGNYSNDQRYNGDGFDDPSRYVENAEY